MYRNWDEIPFLVFLSEKEYQTVRELMEKGRNGTITQEESDLVDNLLEKNNSHYECPPPEEFDRLLKEEELKMYVCSTLYGAIVGDALGVPVEFKDRDFLKQNPVSDMIGYGTYNLPKGSWSDDSSMVIATMEWYDELEEWPEDYKPLMEKFCEWLMHGEYTPYGTNFDNGITVSRALMNYARGMEPVESGERAENSNGNGSLMRILPTALFHTTDLAFEPFHYPEKIYDLKLQYGVF